MRLTPTVDSWFFVIRDSKIRAIFASWPHCSVMSNTMKNTTRVICYRIILRFFVSATQSNTDNTMHFLSVLTPLLYSGIAMTPFVTHNP